MQARGGQQGGARASERPISSTLQLQPRYFGLLFLQKVRAEDQLPRHSQAQSVGGGAKGKRGPESI